MNKLIAVVAALVVSGAAFAQAGTAVKEGAKATADTARQATENTEAAGGSVVAIEIGCNRKGIGAGICILELESLV